MANEFLAARPVGHLRLRFESEGESELKIPSSLSAVQPIGNTLWLVGDESRSVERLTSGDYTNYNVHHSFDLAAYFKLPGPSDEEVDLEGIAWDEENGRLWIVGSHSYRRKQPKPGASDEDAWKALSKTDRQANRYLLGYLELTGLPVNAEGGASSVAPSKGFALPFDDTSSRLIDALSASKTYEPFLDLPSKDNGFDIEGLAVANGRVFVGLRGPVLRGWATILQLTLASHDDGTLTLERKNGDRHDYVRHIFDLGGLGIRDLCVWNEAMLILAGPTMDLGGPMRIFLWRDAFHHDRNRCIDGSRLELLFELPYGDRIDHAEGIALFQRPGEAPKLLVVYDSPAKGRLHEGSYYKADLFRLD
jgi:hypothetical protein